MVDEVVNILDMIELFGEDTVKDVLSDFSCPDNREIENFVHNNAIDFAKRKVSITFLVFDTTGKFCGVFALTHKAIELEASQMSNRAKRIMDRFANLDEATGQYMVSAFLIGQFGKNFKDKESMTITGNELMHSTMTKLASIQHEIGGGIVYLDCEDKEPLLRFYENESNHFRRCGEHISKTDQTRYIRMMRLF